MQATQKGHRTIGSSGAAALTVFEVDLDSDGDGEIAGGWPVVACRIRVCQEGTVFGGAQGRAEF